MRSRWATGLILVVVLMATGILTTWQSRPAWREIRSREPALNLAEVGAGVGHGLSLGLLGGFRALAADLLWLRMNLAWESRDLPKTQALIELTTAVDPRPLYFWINGARIIAYDMPVWRQERLARAGMKLPGEVKTRIDREQAGIALRFLEKRVALDGENPWVEIEMANINLWRLKDIKTAAAHYRRAAGMPDAPFFAARIYGELLKQMGRDREALEWLVALHPTLPPGNSEAMADVVLERIRALEEKLGIPEAERYRPPTPAATGNSVQSG